MMHRSKTKIAGAGLAGLSTAIGLAQSDRLVEVFEAAPDSGWRRNATWDAVENWTTETDFGILLNRWKINRRFECRPICNFEIYNSRGECHSITTPSPILYLVKRGNQPGTLENALKEQALECGVTIHYNKRRDPHDVDVWAVGAQRRCQFLGAGIKFQTRHPDTVKLMISASHAPKAYAYLFVTEGQGILSVTLTRNFANARTYLQQSLEFFRRVGLLDIENVRWTSGFGASRADFWRRETKPLRVGEAAGFQDYLWGFGIRFALHSGTLAANAIAQGSDYNQAICSQIHPQVYASMLNRAMYDRAGDSAYRFLIRRFARSPQLVRLLRTHYCPSIPKSLLALLWRVQLTQGDRS